MTNNKAREINSPLIKELINETTPEELAKIDAEMTNNKQQTSVDSIIEFMKNNQYFIGNDLYEYLEQAKEMEKQQIIDAYLKGWIKVFDKRDEDAENYYNETYGDDKQ